MATPIETLIDRSVRCLKCGTEGVGNCDCWGEKKPQSEVVFQGKWFDIVKVGRDGRKKPDYAILTRKASVPLGFVSWYAPWRQYTLFPEADTVWSWGCLHDIEAFLRKVNRG